MWTAAPHHQVQQCGSWAEQSAGSSKFKQRIAMGFSSSTLHRPKRIENRYLNRFFYMYIHSSLIHNGQKVQTIQMSIYRWLHKQMWSIHAMEYDSVIKRNEVVKHCYNIDEPLNILLNEISQTQRDNYCTIPLIWNSQNRHFFRANTTYILLIT